MSDHELELARLRASVDTIDDQIVALLNRRAQLAIEMGRMKKKMKKSLRDHDRELQVKENLKRLSVGQNLSHQDVIAFYDMIMAVCLKAQQAQDCEPESAPL